jgi:hypothetical protein
MTDAKLKHLVKHLDGGQDQRHTIMKIKTPKTDVSEYASAKVKPSRMAVDADFARMLEQHEAMWRITAHLLADTLIKETDCDADESCECAGCKALVQYEKTKRATAAIKSK